MYLQHNESNISPIHQPQGFVLLGKARASRWFGDHPNTTELWGCSAENPPPHVSSVTESVLYEFDVFQVVLDDAD